VKERRGKGMPRKDLGDNLNPRQQELQASVIVAVIELLESLKEEGFKEVWEQPDRKIDILIFVDSRELAQTASLHIGGDDDRLLVLLTREVARLRARRGEDSGA
jgi:hypothetical protein